jgi:hypothetical protein
MTREIPLTRDMVALVDDEDYERVMALGKWIAAPNGQTFYAIRTVICRCAGYTRRCRVSVHNVVLDALYVDHINGDGLDNRRSNLRYASPTQNSQNRRPSSRNKSGFKGISPKCGRWQAQLQLPGGRNVHIGTFDTPEEAARAYDTAARKHFGEFAWLNFPAEAVTS